MTEVHNRHPQFLPDQRQFFDELISEHWDTYTSDDWDESRRFEVDRLFSIVKPKFVLDIGCGCGFHDAEMARHTFVERVDAIDYSKKSIEKAEQAYPHPRVRRWVADFAKLPESQRYDLIASFQVFEHLHNPDDYLRACKRLLASEGAIAISTPNWHRLDNRIRRWRGLRPTLLDPQHFCEYTPTSLKSMAAQHGLRPIAWFGYDITSLMLPQLNVLGYRRRLHIGYWLPRMSRAFCMVFRAE